MKCSHLEIVRTDAGWHSRFLDSRGRIVWKTATYPSASEAAAAIRSLATMFSPSARARLRRGGVEVGLEGLGARFDSYSVPVLDVDERSKACCDRPAAALAPRARPDHRVQVGAEMSTLAERLEGLLSSWSDIHGDARMDIAGMELYGAAYRECISDVREALADTVTADCGHLYENGPVGARCIRAAHPHNPNGHVYSSRSVPDGHDATEAAAERSRG